MRRSNRVSASKQRTTHLDLPANDDAGDAASKFHKRQGASKAAVAVAVLCGLAALGTLFYVSNKVFAGGIAAGGTRDARNAAIFSGGTGVARKTGGAGSHSSTHGDRFMAQAPHLPPDSIYRTTVKDIHGTAQDLMQYSGSVSLVVNVACE